MIADGNPMGVFPEIVNDGTGSVKRFLAIRFPFFTVTGIKKLLEFIIIAIFFC